MKKGTTSFKDTIFGILPRKKVLELEIKADKPSDRKRYIKALQSADNGNYSQLEKLIETALIESLNKVNT